MNTCLRELIKEVFVFQNNSDINLFQQSHLTTILSNLFVFFKNILYLGSVNINKDVSEDRTEL